MRGYILFLNFYEEIKFTYTCTCRFGNPGELIDKVEGTLLDYDTDFQLLKQA